LKHQPPNKVLQFFRWFCHPDLQKYIEGDLRELYDERLKKSGKRKADIKFVLDVLLLFRPGIIRPTTEYRNVNNYGMYKSYFKIGWRNILKNKGYSFINIGGLTCGMTVALLIALWVYDELSFNKYHKNYETIAQVYRKETAGGETDVNYVQVTGLGTLLRNEYGAHFKTVVLLRSRVEDRVLTSGDGKFSQLGFFMQPEGAELFSLKMKQGRLDGLKDLNSIFLSESLAKKIFGDRDPINQMITMDAKFELLVTGVYEDLPKNSEFAEASYFAPLDLFLKDWSHLNVWDNYNMRLYVQLVNKDDVAKVSAIIKNAMLPHIDEGKRKTNPELFLQPMREWRLNTTFENGIPVTGERLKFVWFFSITGAFVLLLACINFMNLSTARSEKRAKEVGIRKSIGSLRSQLIQQFIGESLLISFVALVLSLILTALLTPAFNNIADKEISVPWLSGGFWLSAVSVSVIAGLLAGSYPALYLSTFNPVHVLKGAFRSARSAAIARRALVVTQFTFSISLIIATCIVYRQIQFAKNRPVGYSRDGLLSIHPRSPQYYGKYNLLRAEFKKTGVVQEIAESNYAVTSTLGWNVGFEWKGKPANMSGPAFNINQVTSEYGRTIGWTFVSGRDFSEDIRSDLNGVVINESAARLMGLENPAGETLIRDRGEGQRDQYTILGVITDMVKGSPFEPTDPCLFFLSDKDQDWLFIRLDPSVSAHEALPKIEKVFAQHIPSSPFDYKFASDEYEAKFRSEERIGTLSSIFSSLAILISCSGLFGLVSFVAEQRTKEIGIRKVMGASIVQVWQLLTNEFVLLVLVACAIAIPLSYYFMADWLAQYKYRTTIAWYLFALAGGGALVITLLTVSIQAVKAAMANPVNSLRSE
jgi:putative ABC transport system permease protein